VREPDGRPALAGQTDIMLGLETREAAAAPAEFLATFRLNPVAGGSARVTLQMACAERADKTQQSLTVMVSSSVDRKSVLPGLSAEGGKAPPINDVLFLQSVADRSLTWPDAMRQTIEAEMAQAPKLEDMIFTLRCTLDHGRLRSWLSGRYLGELTLDPGFQTSGVFKIQLISGAELLSARVRPFKAEDRFEPLALDLNVNASSIDGKKIDHASLPGSGTEASAVDGVPFLFTAPTPRGDHVDMGASWTRFGALPGYFDAQSIGAFGGRWTSGDKIDPARICMYVPHGRYKALHLIAAADDEADSVPTVTAQFYRPSAGHPFNFAGTVPEFDGSGKHAVKVRTIDGKKVKLFHVVIPIDPDALSWFSDLNRIGLELTKQVQFYRGYPDPLEYSWHGAGLPSSVHIYAATLERVGVDIDIKPDQFGHIWTAPATPGYTFELRNSTGKATTAKLLIQTRSQDGKDTSKRELSVALPATDQAVTSPVVTLKPERYGVHEMTVTLTAGDEKATFHRHFAYLHEDTRDHTTWETGHGSVFGYWPLSGGHDTPTIDHEIPVMATAGAETTTNNYNLASYPASTKALAEKYHMISEAAFESGAAYYTTFKDMMRGGPADLPVYDPAHPEQTGKNLVESLRHMKIAPSPISRPTYLPFFTEHQIGPITMGIWPSHYGESYTLTKPEQAMYDDLLSRFLLGARGVHKEWPNIKLLVPYGDPMVTAVFLKLSPESRELIDGCALDMPGFERLPEQQINQVVFSRMYTIMKDIHEFKKDPYLVLVEGFSVSSQDIDTGPKGQAEVGIRDFLTLMGYGVTRFEGTNNAYDCANYWGENHYGGGWCDRLPVATPKPGYVQYATLTRHLNRANFSKYVPTGSTSTYCEQFKHYKTGKLIHVLWTIRGTRPVSVKVPDGATLELYDPNDNVTVLKEKNGLVTFNVDQSPVYLEGLTADAEITLGESDHSDSRPGEESRKLASFGDGSWSLVKKDDLEYKHNKPLQIERFLADMTAHVVAKKDLPPEASRVHAGLRSALAIHLEKQDKDRGVMPFYTTLEPKQPVVIPGKASHLGVWVHAASDWGRIVYVVRDAKGEKWLSVGTKEEWNNDDIHCWSAFCFDGWRYLRFELPSNAPYDNFREYGSTWWGSYGGDNVVDLPLSLVKVIVERRPKVIYGNDLVPAKPDDVLLGDLYAEYTSKADRGEEVVRLSKLRMPPPAAAPEMANPIADLAKTGVGAPTKVLRVSDPPSQPDGTRCDVHFEPVAGAKSYDVWVSPYADGRGAMQLGTGWTASGNLIAGLRPDMPFYAFVVYTDKDGKPSKPSPALRFELKDRFGNK
jgi:hypothetical protein